MRIHLTPDDRADLAEAIYNLETEGNLK
jgi:hypothetical protein